MTPKPSKSSGSPASAGPQPQASTAQTIDLARLTIQLKSILVPVDFSPPSEKALHYALSFADQFGASLVLLYVVEPAIYPVELGYIPVDIETLYRTMDEGARERLRALAEKHIPRNLRTQIEVRIGQPHREIASAAKELNVDLIIIATHGHTGLKHTFLGSTAERVVRHAPCPVLTVREREHDFV